MIVGDGDSCHGVMERTNDLCLRHLLGSNYASLAIVATLSRFARDWPKAST